MTKPSNFLIKLKYGEISRQIFARDERGAYSLNSMPKKANTDKNCCSLYDTVLCRQIIENSRDGIVVYGKDLKYRLWNPMMEKLTGLPAEDVIGRHPLDLFPFLEESGVMERLRRSLEGDEIIKVEFPYEISQTGARGWVADESAPLLDENNEIIGVIATVRDITERKMMEDSLHDRGWRLESIIEGARVGTWEWNAQTGETTFNERWAEIVGYTLEELSPISIKTWEALAHPDDMAKSGELLNKHFSGEIPYYDCECRMRHKDGRWVWVHDRGKVITRTEDGKPLMVFGTHTDINDRKMVETYRELTTEILQFFNEPLRMREIIDKVLEVIQERTGFDAVGVRLREGDDFPYFAHRGFLPGFIEMENSLIKRDENGNALRDSNGQISLDCACGLVITGTIDLSNPIFTKGGAIWTNNSADTPLFDPIPGVNNHHQCAKCGYASIALAPIRSKDKIVGLLQINDHRKGCFSRLAIGQLESMAAQIGESILRKRAEDELIETKNALFHESTHDPLTGVLNRRALNTALAREISMVKRMRNGLAVGVFDVDHFKDINDKYGHRVGDEVLCGLVKIVSSTLRNYDYLGRWGGDEFVIISAACGDFEGIGFFERLREKVERTPIQTKAGAMNIAISIGVKKWTEEDSEAAMFEAADSALYRAKKTGKNRGCLAGK